MTFFPSKIRITNQLIIIAFVGALVSCHSKRARLVEIKRIAIEQMAMDHSVIEINKELYSAARIDSSDQFLEGMKKAFVDSVDMQGRIDSCKDELEK